MKSLPKKTEPLIKKFTAKPKARKLVFTQRISGQTPDMSKGKEIYNWWSSCDERK